MKKYLVAAAAAAVLLASGTAAMAEAVKLQLKWVTQAQFAGYYVALAWPRASTRMPAST
jgi:NitT/TauT family transport system substrate-binding protein